jgi:hypothetical protein
LQLTRRNSAQEGQFTEQLHVGSDWLRAAGELAVLWMVNVADETR